MSSYRMRVRFGVAEFEAEGEESSVREDFRAFLERIGEAATSQAMQPSQPSAPVTSDIIAPPAAPEQAESGYLSEDADRVMSLYDHDSKRKIVSLRFPAQGSDRLPKTLLLILYGFKRIREEDEVPVTSLTIALRQSGFNVGRLDRIAASIVRDGLVIKGGKAKGGKYRLTNLGHQKAETELRQLAELVQ